MSKTRAPKSRGKQCCVYGCYNYSLLSDGTTSGIHFFRIPKSVLADKRKKERWCNLIKRQDGKDGFSLNNHTVICEKHFTKDQINISLVTKRWTLKPDNQPCEFQWNKEKNTRKSPNKRNRPIMLQKDHDTDYDHKELE